MPKSKNLPNLVITGVVKGGTTSIFSYLSRHPDICSSSVKETCYFLTYRYGQLDKRYRTTSNPFLQYQGYFSHSQNEKYIMEATPGYFDGGGILATEMKKVLGNDVKILIILREPVDRLLSFFKYKKSMLELEKSLSLEAYISQCQALPIEERCKEENDAFWGIDGGLYSNYLESWFNIFGDSIKIVFFDQLQKDSRLLLKDISNWLDIDPTFFENETLDVENKTVGYKYERIQEIALSFNMKAEKFWRANPRLKKKIRDIYYYINGDKQQEDNNENVLKTLYSIYEPYNKVLASQLQKKGYIDLPIWLNN